MSEAKGQQEPSMEEILASIRRIIAEDSDAPAETVDAAPPQPPAPPVAEPMPIDEPEPEDDEDVLELTEELPEAPPPPPAPSMPPQPSTTLISDTAAAAAGASFAALARRREPSRELPIGNGAVTLEQMVREMVAPMLKTWLDANLPSIVERLVQEEVRRISAMQMQ